MCPILGNLFWEFFMSKVRANLIATALAVAVLASGFGSPRLVWAAQQPASNGAITPKTNANPLDINTASSEQLKSLPGVGDAYVRRIIAGRPYTAKNQLVTRGVLPQAAYDQLASQIIAKRPR
jgi:competence protein ComEA